MEAVDQLRPSAEPDEPLEGSVTRRAIGWSVLNTLIGRFGGTFVGVVLARILIPEDYGTFAVALVGLNALLSVNELGVSLAIVRWPRDVARIAPTVVTLAIATSTMLWIAVLLAAPAVAAVMNAPESTGVLRALSASVVIDALTAVPAALMTRAFMQKQRMLVDLAGFALTSGLSIGLAAAGFGAWSLVWGALAGNVLNGILVVRQAPRWYNPGFDPKAARELIRFGAPLALASLLVFALLNVDYVVVGAHTNPAQLGFYLLAFNLSTWPVNVFSAPARRVSMPAFARLHAGETSASAAFVPACTALLTVTLPACLLLALFAAPLISLVYGDKWTAAERVLPWLMALALARVLGELAYDFLVALDRPRATLAVQGLWLAAAVPALIAGAMWKGIEGVAIAHMLVALLVALPAYGVVLSQSGVSIPALFRDLARPAVATLLALAVALLALRTLDADFAQIAIGGGLATAVYLAVVWQMRHRFLNMGGSVVEV